jgi:predicted nucleic acid-binding protein
MSDESESGEREPAVSSDTSGTDGSRVERAETDAPETDAPDPTRVVADADVLAADLLVGGVARDALDHVREHSWVDLVASDPLLDDCEAVVASCADPELAAAHREKLDDVRVRVDHPEGDHPAVASAYHGDAAHLLSFDEDLGSAQAGAALRAHVDTSVKHPDAFARLFAPERLWPEVGDGAYPGPDRDPRD